MSLMMLYELTLACGETLYMVFAGTFFALILGLPLGTWLYITERLKPNKHLYRILSGIINISRSIPFIILIVALIPFTRLIAGTSIGTNAALVPLTLGATPFFARLVENIYQTLPKGLIETGQSMGAGIWHMIRFILIPEALPGIINAVTVTAVTLVNYSAMAGAVGGGGLGDLAIRYGYQRFDAMIMLTTVIILVVIVQLIQQCGDYLSRRCTH